MVAAKYNFTIEQGSTFSRSFVFPSSYLMPQSCRWQARELLESTTTLMSFDSLTASNNLLINTTTQTITMLIEDTVTKNYNFNTAVYDFELVYPSSVVRLLEGTVTLSKEVTR